MNLRKRIFAIALFGLFFNPLAASENVDFLTVYDLLQPVPDNPDVLLYISEGATERMSAYTSMMVDQPELFINEDSRYKGMKPDTMVEIGEEIRSAVIDGLSDTFEITEEPGPDVLYLRMAATDLYILKQKRGLLGYTPIGAVVGGVKNAASEFVEKNTLVEMTLEVELLDSTSNEVLAGAIFSRGQRKDKKANQKEEPVNWERMNFAFNALGKRLGCRLNNTRVAEDQRADCMQIPLLPEED